MSTKEKYIGEAKVKEEPRKKLSLKIADGAVTTDKIQNGAVTKDKMAEKSVGLPELASDVHQALASVHEGGIAVTNDFGDSEYIGISQKTITEMKEGLEEDIEEIQESISEDGDRISTLEDEVLDEGENTLKSRVGDLEEAVGTGGSVDTRIAAETSRALAAETALANGIEGLTQSDIVVGALPASGEDNTIYRVPGENSYEDYAWDGEEFVSLAEYDNAIDDVPTEDSNNLVKSGGIYNATPSNVGTGNEADFEISDEYKNVLCVFNNGHIKTMNFDSETDTPIKGAKIDDADLKISDESGNVLCVFEDGHIRTKNFNSQVFAKMPANGYENFLYDVNTYIPSQSTAQTLQDGIDLKKDRGIIVLPDNYDESGKAVRLIIANQGSSGRVLSSDTMPHNCCPFADLMLAEGYAVLQINGTPGYTDGIATYGASGNPDYLKSIVKAYEYVVQKYNIRRDGVLLAGFSQGTLKCWQIAANKTIPVIACVMFGPCLDLWKLMYPYTTPAQRQFICQRFGFVEKEANEYVLEYFGSIYQQGDIVTAPSSFTSAGYKANDYELAYILNNYELWKGYDPICWGTTKNIIGKQFSVVNWVTTEDSEEDAIYADVGIVVPCPMKLFVGLSDVTTTPKLTRWYKGMADNSGMKLDVRYYEGGDHHFTSSYPTISVQTKYGGTITTNLPSWEGMLYLERLDY